MVNIFEYLDYREFLKDAFEEKKEMNKRFSHRMFARMAGFRSSNFIMLVMQGKRGLSDDGIYKLARALKLKKRESDYFENLVRFGQAKIDDEKRRYYERVIEHYAKKTSRRLEAWQYEYYSKWYMPVIHEMVLIDGFKEDPEWISSKLEWKVSVWDIKHALNTLFELKLLKKDKNGKVVQAHPHVESGDDIGSLTVSKFQKEMILKAADSIDKVHYKEREIGSVTFPVSQERLLEAKEMIRAFRSRLATFLGSDTRQDTVCQFNIQLFGLTKLERRGKRDGEREEV